MKNRETKVKLWFVGLHDKNGVDMIEELRQYQLTSEKSWYRLAKELNIAEQTMHNWKTGKHKPNKFYKRIIKRYLKKQSS